jgi:hypothetical protein
MAVAKMIKVKEGRYCEYISAIAIDRVAIVNNCYKDVVEVTLRNGKTHYIESKDVSALLESIVRDIETEKEE